MKNTNNFLVLLILLLIPSIFYSSDLINLIELYSLKSTENIKFFKYPYDDIRNNNIQLLSPQLSDKYLKKYNSVYFEFSNDSLIYKSTIGGQSTIKMVISKVLPYEYFEIMGDSSVLDIKMTGDFIYRSETPLNDLISDLQILLSKETGTKVNLSRINIKKEVIVASGEYNFVPLKDHPQDTLFIYIGNRPNKINYCCPRTTEPVDLNVFFTLLGLVFDKPIINEVSNSSKLLPVLGICARPTEREQINKLFMNISEQINITLKEDIRNVEVLNVTK